MVSAGRDHSLSLTDGPAKGSDELSLRDRNFHAFVEILPAPLQTNQSGTLTGQTFAAKDMFVFRDRHPLCGLSHPPALGLLGTASVISRLLDAGAGLAGFTTLTALAYEPSGVNGDGSRPINPWGASLITGGSSSGSAVAVAACLVDFAIGSDTAGSLRIPAQACGVASYKPSYGLIPVDGAMTLAPSLDCVGVLARDVGLLQTVAKEFIGPSQADPLRFYFAADLDSLCAPEVTRQMQQLRMTMESQAVDYSSMSLMPMIKAADAPLFALLEGEAAQSFSCLLKENILPEKLAHRLAKGQRLDADTLHNARQSAVALHAKWLEQLPPDACVILPAMPCCTPEIDSCTQGSAQFSAKALYALSEFTRLGSLLGLPVVTVPVGLDQRSAPLAVQVMGHRGQDLAVLAAALKIQSLFHFDELRSAMNGRDM